MPLDHRLTSESKRTRKSGDRRHESRRAVGLPEAALALYRGAAVAWELATTTGETGGNPEAGRRGAQAWHRNGAGSIDPAGGEVKRNLGCKRWAIGKTDEN